MVFTASLAYVQGLGDSVEKRRQVHLLCPLRTALYSTFSCLVVCGNHYQIVVTEKNQPYTGTTRVLGSPKAGMSNAVKRLLYIQHLRRCPASQEGK